MTAKTKTPFDDYKDSSLTRPKNVAWNNWAKFVKIGDKVQGFVRDAFYQKATAGFPEKRGITLEQLDGTLINVAIKRLPFVLQDTDDLHLGDPLTVELTSFGDKVPGKNPAKIFTFYGKKLSENAEKPTVKELDNADRIAGGTELSDDVEEDFVATGEPHQSGREEDIPPFDAEGK